MDSAPIAVARLSRLSISVCPVNHEHDNNDVSAAGVAVIIFGPNIMPNGTMILTLVGIGIIVVGVLLILQLRSMPPPAKKEVVEIDVDPVGWGWSGGWPPAWNWQPYYSRMPLRPLLY
jgi:hypothetical protein